MSIFNQVRPPGDVLPDIIRSLASATNITNAGILYDNSFGQQRQIACSSNLIDEGLQN